MWRTNHWAAATQHFTCGSAPLQQRAGAPLSWSVADPNLCPRGPGSKTSPPQNCTCQWHTHTRLSVSLYHLPVCFFYCLPVQLKCNKPVCLLIWRCFISAFNGPSSPVQFRHLTEHTPTNNQSLWVCFCVSVCVCVCACLPPLLSEQG